MTPEAWLRLYNLMINLGLALGAPLLVPLAAASAKRRATAAWRLGARRTVLPPVRAGRRGRTWLHALSVGEVLSAVPLVEALARQERDRDLVCSVSTRTGFEVADRALRSRVEALFYFPYDLRKSVRRAVDAVAPDCVIVVETDIWPNFMALIGARGIPAVLVNARLSRASWRGYRRLRGLARPMLQAFAAICTQTHTDARRFEDLGVSPQRITVTGNLKFDAPVPAVNGPQRAALQRAVHALPGRPVLLAGSTHPGEEAVICRAWGEIRRAFPDALLVIAPRDPQRAAAVERLFAADGWQANRLADPAAPGSRTVAVAVVDRLGILAQLYALADVAFVGGSLVADGGHNPLEAAAVGCPVLFGPDMSDFEEIAGLLVAAGGARRVAGARELTAAVVALLREKDRRLQMGRSARKVFEDHRGAVSRTLQVIEQVTGRRP